MSAKRQFENVCDGFSLVFPRQRAYHSVIECFRRVARMDWPDYLREQATMYRQQAERTDDPIVKNELLELASVCEEVANNIEDHLTGG